MTHVLITALFCVVCHFLSCPIGSLFIAGFYVGRELAQAEYRYIEAFCGRKRARMPWYAPFTPAAWTVKGMLDWIFPAVQVAFFLWLEGV